MCAYVSRELNVLPCILSLPVYRPVESDICMLNSTNIKMGNELSTNVSKETVNVLNNVFNSVSNSCVTQATQNQSIDLSGLTGSSIILTADWSQQLVVNASCLATSNLSTNLSNAIAQEATQLAESTEQQFSLATFGEAENYVKIMTNLSNTITNVYVNECQVTSEQIQNITISNSQAQLVTANTLWTQTLNTTSNCVFNNTAVTAIQNQIQQSVKQTAEATTENFLEGALLGLALVIASAGVFLFGIGGMGGSGATGQGKPTGEAVIASGAVGALTPGK